MTLIKPCTCVHAYQDEKYGKRNRVHNTTVSTAHDHRCTVCNKTTKK